MGSDSKRVRSLEAMSPFILSRTFTNICKISIGVIERTFSVSLYPNRNYYIGSYVWRLVFFDLLRWILMIG
jgi:hypothetical protein